MCEVCFHKFCSYLLSNAFYILSGLVLFVYVNVPDLESYVDLGNIYKWSLGCKGRGNGLHLSKECKNVLS